MNTYRIEKGTLHIYKECDKYFPLTEMSREEKQQFCEDGKFKFTVLHFKNPNNGKWETKEISGERFTATVFRAACLPKTISDCLNCPYSDCINTGVQRVSPAENNVVKEFFPNKEKIILTVDEKVKGYRI